MGMQIFFFLSCTQARVIWLSGIKCPDATVMDICCSKGFVAIHVHLCC